MQIPGKSRGRLSCVERAWCKLGPYIRAGAAVFRHAFLFTLNSKSAANLTAVSNYLKNLPLKAPASGRPTSNQWGVDLGISSTLYSPSKIGWQADVGGILEFDSEAKLRGYFAWLYTSPDFKPFSSLLNNSSRMQYITTTCGPQPTGIWRHQFAYRFDNLTIGANTYYPSYDKVEAAKLYITKAVTTAPVTPVSYALESDLGIVRQLSASPVGPYNFGGVIDFKSQADLTAWWKWLLTQPEYKALVATVSAAGRIQYKW